MYMIYSNLNKGHNNAIAERDIKKAFDKNDGEYTEQEIYNVLDVF